ncbi:universal stress protein [Natronorarus salvus]|uniref:universal stress protein n=1 Tax=Natronorarus salvus TaxID=3117733 RepID=UPI002F25FCDA
MYSDILLPTDGSEAAESAINHALAIGNCFDALVHVLHVTDSSHPDQSHGGQRFDQVGTDQFSERETLAEIGREAIGTVTSEAESRGVDTVEHIVPGQPARVIAHYVENEGIDLVVMGSRGHQGVKRALLGSVTERVTGLVDVPVLVTTPGETNEGDG